MSSSPSQTQLDETAVENFREYLRIPSVQPDVNYDDCVAFLRRQAVSLGLPVRVYEPYKKKPIVVITWIGKDPAAPAILLNSHMDVVPVFADKWTHPPFDAHMDDKGNIFARGAQDMKCVGIQYLEAIRRLKQNGQTFKRTIHMSFVPDEEIGGVLGMREFVHTDDFKALNIGFSLDEGCASPTETFFMFNGERSIWHVWVHCHGQPGHGSLMLPNTAGEKIRVIIDRFMDLRAQEASKLTATSLPGNVLSINLNQLKGGVQTNVIPEELIAVFDMRIPPTLDHNELEQKILGWCKEAGENVTITFEQKNPRIESTKLDDSNPFWIAFKKSCDELGLNVRNEVFPGGTDSRYVRQVGIPAICFSPMNNTTIKLHDHDEYLNKNIFLRGIEIYMRIIPSVANA
ncbi:aminoacylase-1 [Fopius arisanus]|uniref:N-acyl-aliphatic-L-amino acid amidohydrolase n=1 Tax=Fopius arisanus TaxID=64838 RepID=A0A9R1SUV1_9HYME|nr:PREDICTED: aminoacylase-1-like [Fopius arisanus]